MLRFAKIGYCKETGKKRRKELVHIKKMSNVQTFKAQSLFPVYRYQSQKPAWLENRIIWQN